MEVIPLDGKRPEICGMPRKTWIRLEYRFGNMKHKVNREILMRRNLRSKNDQLEVQ